jgi:hypothetical protein
MDYSESLKSSRPALGAASFSTAAHSSAGPPLKAGSTDDNADADKFASFVAKTLPSCRAHADELNIDEPVEVLVTDAHGLPAPGANVSVIDPVTARVLWQGLTYGDGKTVMYPHLVPPSRGQERGGGRWRGADGPHASLGGLGGHGPSHSGWVVTAHVPPTHMMPPQPNEAGGGSQQAGGEDGLAAVAVSAEQLRKGGPRRVTVALPSADRSGAGGDVTHGGGGLHNSAVASRVPIDVAFIIDATGSMADEIAKLKSSLLALVDQLRRDKRPVDLRFAAIVYRDRGDAYRLKLHPFTTNVSAFSEALNQAVFAEGGGDGPESLNEALVVASSGLAWRPHAAKVAFLVADAPPHMDYMDEDATYGTAALAALHHGIRIHTLAASGLDSYGDKCGTLVFRQVAQLTRGKFMFLEYGDSQPVATAVAMTTHGVGGRVESNNLDAILLREIGLEIAGFGVKAASQVPA